MTEENPPLKEYVKKAIELLCKKNYSDVVILSSYKINSIIKEYFGVNIKVDKIGRVLSKIAKMNKLKRLQTNIPKYQIRISKFYKMKF